MRKITTIFLISILLLSVSCAGKSAEQDPGADMDWAAYSLYSQANEHFHSAPKVALDGKWHVKGYSDDEIFFDDRITIRDKYIKSEKDIEKETLHINNVYLDMPYKGPEYVNASSKTYFKDGTRYMDNANRNPKMKTSEPAETILKEMDIYYFDLEKDMIQSQSLEEGKCVFTLNSEKTHARIAELFYTFFMPSPASDIVEPNLSFDEISLEALVGENNRFEYINLVSSGSMVYMTHEKRIITVELTMRINPREDEGLQIEYPTDLDEYRWVK